MTNESFTVRSATQDDAEAVSGLWRLMADQHRQYDAEAWCWSRDSQDKWKQGFAKRVGDPDTVALVAESQDGQLMGFVQAVVRDSPEIFSTRRHGEVWDLVVRPQHREKGVGRRLMEATVAGLRARGAEYVRLHVAIANDAAVKLYEQIGFRQTMYRMHKKL